MAYYIHQCCISAQFVVHRGHLPWVTAAEKITVLESGWAAPADVVLPGVGLAALAAADGPLPPGWSRAKAELHSPRRQPVALAAALSQWACAGTSGRAAPPYKQTTQQSPPSASSLPAAGGHRRPCWSGVCVCRIRLGPG